MDGIVIETEKEAESASIQAQLAEAVSRLTEEAFRTEDWVFATKKQIQETYPIPSAFEAYVKEVTGINER